MPARARSRPTAKKSRKVANVSIARLVKTMGQPSGTARYAAGSALVARAQASPAQVYHCFDEIADLLHSESNIIVWCALRAIGALAPADVDGKIDTLLDSYLAFIRCGKLITAANAIVGAGLIAQAQPALQVRIVAALLEIEKLDFGTPECRNVAIGHALDAFARLPEEVRDPPAVAAFIERQQSNTRSAVARRAARLMSHPATRQSPRNRENAASK